MAQLGKRLRTHGKNSQLTLEGTSGQLNLIGRLLSKAGRVRQSAEIGVMLKTMHTPGLKFTAQGNVHAVRDYYRSENLFDYPSDGEEPAPLCLQQGIYHHR